MGVKRFGRIVRLFVLIYLQTLAAVVAVQLLWPRDIVPAQADTIICLGGGSDPGVIHRNSYVRALRCVELFEAGVADRIYFTGFSAGPLMADVAVANGVPRDAIGIEPASRSTLQNALFTSRDVSTDARVIVVSNAFHLPRAWVSFRVMGFENVTPVAAGSPRLYPPPLLREALAIWFNAGRATLWALTPWLNQDVRESLLI